MAILRKAEPVKDMVRAIRLNDGDVITFLNTIKLEFEGDLFYEVKEVGRDFFGQPKYKRTGKSYTPAQLNSWM